MLIEFKLPELGENIKSGIAAKVMVKAGDTVKKDQPVVELETEKAVLEIPSPVAGIIKEVFIKVGNEVKVGQVVLKIETSEVIKEETKTAFVPPRETDVKKEPAEKAAPQIALPPKPATVTSEPPQVRGDVSAAPSVRRFAREIGIDIVQVPGTGLSGRISIDDVKAYAKALNTGTLRGASAVGIAPVILPDFSKWGQIDRQPMSTVRRKTAEHVSQAWTTIPHVTQFDKADITDLETLRKRYAKKVENKGGKLTITPFILKVLASALKAFPQFNASIDMSRSEIIYKKYYNIGVAVDTDRWLLVPVVRDVDKKGIIELTVELAQMAERARNKKTALEEMQGGTFTITNLGGIGGTYFTPIVNSPEVAILGISRSSIEPSYNGNFCSPRLMLPLCLSYDHRLIDGADGARFLRRVIEAIEQPFVMDLEG